MATMYDAAEVQALLSGGPETGRALVGLGNGVAWPTRDHAAADATSIGSQAPDSSRSDGRVCQTRAPVGSRRETS